MPEQENHMGLQNDLIKDFMKNSKISESDPNQEKKSSKEDSRKTYIGTKVVNAYPQTHHASLLARGFETPNEDQPGYAVIYEDGYTSWSPKTVFERCYREITPAEKRMM